MTPVWRLIEHGPVDGALNMALDRAVQLAHEAGAVPPTVRLYSWARPTITLGRFQRLDSLDLAACDRYDVDVVRRFTGGRGVLHDDELTYSVVAGVADGVPRGVAASYRFLCGALARTYQALGVAAALTSHDHGDTASAACYLLTTRADLSVGAMKLSGSAQVWSGDSVLQHGSFTISRDVSREAAVFALKPEQADALAENTFALADAVSPVTSIDTIAGAVRSAFEDEFDIVLSRGELTAWEADKAASLLAQTDASHLPARAR